MIEAPKAVVTATTHVKLEAARNRGVSYRTDAVTLHAKELLDDAVLADLAEAAKQVDDTSFWRVIDSVRAARTGSEKTISSVRAAPAALTELLRRDLIDGWVYVRERDGHLHPYLVMSISQESRQDGSTYVDICCRADAPASPQRDSRHGVIKHVIISAADARKKPSDLLTHHGVFKETPDLKAEYEARLATFQKIANEGFATQFRYTGMPFATETWRDSTPREHRRVVFDIQPSELIPLTGLAKSVLLVEEGIDDSEALGRVPVLTVARVFDLGAHDHIDVNCADLTPYEYDSTLRDKLILPDSQRELLDILTTDLDAFTADIIEGKSAGNVVLGKGTPGVGKTLTAEVYSELIEKPLYSIHSGSLGVSADDIRKNLEQVFRRAKRWNAVLLLDEADVFVLERGSNIVQNAIVAEFLRTLEYFDGLLFMTTNRSNNIDDAILSRCAAIIDYRVPGRADAEKIWRVMATNQGVTLPDQLMTELLDGFPQISPRDIKFLLRLAMKVATHRKVDLSIDLFRQCAIFRGVQYEDNAAGGDPQGSLVAEGATR